jgi:multiphosphoryl transfer protein
MKIDLLAPLSGVFVPIEQCPDPVFSARTLGDGMSIDPTDNILLAPCAGEVVQLHRAGHALTIRTTDNIEILLHIGINTVSLNGQGFTPLVKMGDAVTAGQKLIEFDLDFVASQATSLITQMIVLGSNGKWTSTMKAKQLVSAGEDVVANFVLEETAVASEKTKTAPLPATAKPPEPPVPNPNKGFPKVNSKALEISNSHGLHARPIAVITNAAKHFTSDIFFQLGSKSANAKSVTALLGLDVKKDDVVRIIAQGKDADAAIRTLSQLIASGLGESTPVPGPTPRFVKKVKEEPNENVESITGVQASPGVALGNVVQIRHPDIAVTENAQDERTEEIALTRAIDRAQKDLSLLQQSVSQKVGAAKAAIFGAQEEILSDPDILTSVRTEIRAGKTAAFAWKKTLTAQADALAKSRNELLAARANDIRDVAYRVLRTLVGDSGDMHSELPENAILIAHELTPSDTANLDTSKVRGFCTVTGSSTSHVAILARSLGIPALAAISPQALNIKNGTEVILNADQGFLREKPNLEEIAALKIAQEKLDLEKAESMRHAMEPATTSDGHTLEVVANIGSEGEIKKALALGAEGVGLLRSEFLFLDRQSAPDEEEQSKIYKKMARSLGDRPLIIRTLDVGGDKPLAYLPIPAEENPFLGERGIRVGLNRPEILIPQIRAILRASESGKVLIMFPMIATVAEFKAAKEIVREQADQMNISMIPVGIMVEVPSAALLAEQFASVVDFFSVGTNDLTQYTLAMDRGNSRLAEKIDGMDPSVLKLIDMTVKAGKRHNKWTGVCGGLASENLAIPILIGLGVKELSVSVPALAMIKMQIRKLSHIRCEELAQMALNLSSASQVRDLVKTAYPQGDPHAG